MDATLRISRHGGLTSGREQWARWQAASPTPTRRDAELAPEEVVARGFCLTAMYLPYCRLCHSSITVSGIDVVMRETLLTCV